MTGRDTETLESCRHWDLGITYVDLTLSTAPYTWHPSKKTHTFTDTQVEKLPERAHACSTRIHTQRKCTHSSLTGTYTDNTYTGTHRCVHRSRHGIDCLHGPEVSSLRAPTSSDSGLCRSSPLRGETIFPPVESGLGHRTCSGRRNVSGHNASRALKKCLCGPASLS